MESLSRHGDQTHLMQQTNLKETQSIRPSEGKLMQAELLSSFGYTLASSVILQVEHQA